MLPLELFFHLVRLNLKQWRKLNDDREALKIALLVGNSSEGAPTFANLQWALTLATLCEKWLSRVN